jgi:hypothetical protein
MKRRVSIMEEEIRAYLEEGVLPKFLEIDRLCAPTPYTEASALLNAERKGEARTEQAIVAERKAELAREKARLARMKVELARRKAKLAQIDAEIARNEAKIALLGETEQ